MLVLDIKGILSYYEMKDLTKPKGQVDLNHSHATVKIVRKDSGDLLEVKNSDVTYMFKISPSSSTVSEDGTEEESEVDSWEKELRKFIKVQSQ